jgi:hypothetical protein
MNYENNTFANVSAPKPLSATRQFLQSKSIIAKIAFLALTLIIFIILLKVITKIMMSVFGPSKSPYLLKDLKPANVPTTISQNPNVANSIPIIRSTNQKDGIEFTYSVWMYVHGIPELSEKKYHQVFFKGNTNTPISRNKHPDYSVLPRKVFRTLGKDLSGINYPDNGPGLYLTQIKSKGHNADTLGLALVMNTYRNILEAIVVPDISLKKWICVTIRVMGRNIDIYINGIIVKRHILEDVPKQNYGDVHINANKGYNGSISKMQYFNRGLDAKEIYSIVKRGPNMTVDDSLLVTPPYYSSDWYFSDDKI